MRLSLFSASGCGDSGGDITQRDPICYGQLAVNRLDYVLCVGLGLSVLHCWILVPEG